MAKGTSNLHVTIPMLSLEERLRLFDESTTRQREREKHMALPTSPPAERDWRREDLYTRGKAR